MSKNIEVKSFLNPNPVFESDTLVDPHGKKYHMENYPFIELILIDFKEGEYFIKIKSEKIEFEKKIEIGKKDQSRSVYFKSKKLEGLDKIKINVDIEGVGIKYSDKKILRTFEVRGKVLDTDNNPIFAYIWASRKRLVDNEVISATDENGKFCIKCPAGRELNLFIGDKNYASTTLEAWVMADIISRDIEIPEIKIGSFEVYGLKAWHSASTWHIFFMPAKAGVKVPGDISAEDVDVWIDGEKKDIISITKHLVSGDYPSYFLSVGGEIKNDYPQIIKVRVDSDVGFGEAYYIDE